MLHLALILKTGSTCTSKYHQIIVVIVKNTFYISIVSDIIDYVIWLRQDTIYQSHNIDRLFRSKIFMPNILRNNINRITRKYEIDCVHEMYQMHFNIQCCIYMTWIRTNNITII